MNARDVTRCTCELAVLNDLEGNEVHAVARLDDRCRVHGWPDNEWRANHPLRRHAWVIDRATGAAFPQHEARQRCETYEERPSGATCVDSGDWQRHFRDETPRETEARLRREAS